MNTNDNHLDKIASSVHSPKGEYADKEKAYAMLRQRLDMSDGEKARAEGAPVIGRRHASPWRRIAAVAAVIVVVAAGIAGTYISQKPSAEERTEQKPSTTVTADAPDITFSNATLANIAAQLSTIYDVKITIKNETLAGYKMSGSFAADESITDILDILAEAGHFKYSTTAEGYVIE